MELKIVPLDTIKPYKRNARKNDKAVDAVAESIQQCEYVAPIIVDENNVILAGHTRWKALKKLGYADAEVVVKSGLTEDQKRKYRLLDNKTGELAEWDYDLLAGELDGLEFDGLELDWGADRQIEDMGLVQGEKGQDIEPVETGEYRQFVDKFKPKLTTDDCYTPENIYTCVREWAVKHYDLEGTDVLRPFWPGGDYQSMNYPEGCVVIDNPPFSILSEICCWYNERGIQFFLFAPTLTLFSVGSGRFCYVPCGAKITYANGAKVNTSFVTNLGDWKVELNQELSRRVAEEDDKNRAEAIKELPEYVYPENVITPAICRLAKYGQDLQLQADDLFFTRALDDQKATGKTIYGSGFLLSERAAAERAAAERAAAERAAAERAAAERAGAAKKWTLSKRELKIIKTLGNGCGKGAP